MIEGYKEIIIVDGSDPSIQLHFRAKTAIKNILTSIEVSLGNKLDSKQRFMIRKIVLDEINGFENLSQVLVNGKIPNKNNDPDKT